MSNYAEDWDQYYTVKSKTKFYLSVKKTPVSIACSIENKLLDQ